MSGLNGLVLAFRADASVRIYKGTVMVKSTVNTSIQSEQYAKVPTAANAGGILGVTIEHFKEPNFFIPQPSGSPGAGTNYPENITGTTPASPYDAKLLGVPIDLQVNGVADCIAGTASGKQGDLVVVADAYGRIKSYTSSDFASGSLVYIVGHAQHDWSSVDETVRVLLDFEEFTA
jgi:hypothetical protein